MRSVDGSSVDGSLYRDVVDFAAHTAWLHGIASIYTSYGVVLFFAAMVLTWWFSRRNGAERMGFVLWAPIAAVLAYVVNDVVKNLVQEVRPCRSLPNIHPLLSCPAATDWSFPSNHAVV
ncbi:MAG: phosphatase PAP2 family protein, partial [Sciscionella sp.]